ncbi:MAG: two-component regulator propeller domain-containing protein [Bacteroidota bacterium]
MDLLLRIFRNTFLLFGLPAWIFPCLLLAQSNQLIQFEQRSIEAGLSQSTVICIQQDHRGFLWVGTADGLNQYDGYRFRAWKTGDRGLTSGHIWAIAPSVRDGLWIGTVGGGLHFFDLSKEVFTHISPKNPEDPLPNDVYCIWEAHDGKVWMGTARQGLMIYDPLTERIHHFPAVSGPSSRSIYDLVATDSQTVWLATYAGLVKVSHQPGAEPNEATLTFRRHSAAKHPQLPSNAIRSISPRPDSLLWLGLWPGGLWTFDQKTETFSESFENQEMGPTLSSSYISKVFHDRAGNLWAGTFDQGLGLVLTNQQQALQFRHEAGERNHLESNFVGAIFQDNEGLIWVGTYGGGLHVYSPYRHKFQHYRQNGDRPNSLSHNLIFGMTASKYIAPGRFWITTHGGGVNLYNPDNESFQAIRVHEDEWLSNDVALAVLEDQKQRLWVGTRTGLDMVEGKKLIPWARNGGSLPRMQHFRYDREKPGTLYGSFVWSLMEGKNGAIWAGTRGGLNRYNEEKGTWERWHKGMEAPRQLLGSAVLSLAEGNDGAIWAGTYQGLNEVRLDEKGDVQEIIHHLAHPDSVNGLPHATVNSLAIDHTGRIWAGTGGGLAYKNPTGTFQKIQLNGEWESHVIKGVAVDSSGNLWFSSYNGLGKIDLATMADDQEVRIRKYDVQDGLQSNEFSETSAYCGPDGRLLFGGVNGFSTFYPELLQDNPFEPPVYFTAVHLLNEEVEVGTQNGRGEVLLAQSLTTQNMLQLGYQDDVLQIDFAALSFTLPDKNSYQYRLRPFEAEWVQAGNRHQATYTNLDPGDYTFEVLATNHDGKGQDEPARLMLSVAPPPWQTWWAYLLYSVTVLALIWAYVRFRVRQRENQLRQEAALEQTRIEERERVRKRSAQDFHDELGNKLTRISLYTTLAQRASDQPEGLQDYLGQIQHQAQALSDGMRDFIWVLDPEKDSALDTFMRLKDFGDQLFEPAETRFVSEGLEELGEELEMPLESRRHLLLLGKEALHNALKYAAAERVILRVGREVEALWMEIRDDGKGFDLNQKGQGYGLQNMQKRAEAMQGELTIESEAGKGTRIKVVLPLEETDVFHSDGR